MNTPSPPTPFIRHDYDLRDDTPMRVAAERIVRDLQEKGWEAVLVGGCVRDLLLGSVPKDYDIATDAPPESVEGIFTGSNNVGKSFGVIIVHSDGFDFEVATYRQDGGYSDGRRPDAVVFTDAATDAMRRDFTINALFYDPFSKTLSDYAGGGKDLESKLIRAIGDPAERFSEDFLRMLRAIRFAVRFGFSIDSDTVRAIRGNAGNIVRIAPERIGMELMAVFRNGSPRRAVELLDDTGLLKYILPEVHAMKTVQQPPQFHHGLDVYEHTLQLLDKLMLCDDRIGDHRPSEELILGALLHDIGKPPTFDDTRDRIRFSGHDKVGADMTAEISHRLRLSNAQRDRVVSLVSEHMKFMNVPKMKKSTLRRFVSLPDFADHLSLHRADCMAAARNLDNLHIATQEYDELLATPPELRQALIRGKDLIELGYSPGSLFHEILDKVADLRVEGELDSAENALQWVRENYPDTEPDNS